MTFLDALTVMARRWIVLLLGLAATGVGCTVVLDRVGPDHQASSQMILLLPPLASGPANPTNPYLNLQPDLSTTAALVAGAVSTKDVQRSLVRAGNDAEYAVALSPGTGPLLVITTRDKDAAAAVSTRDAVMELIDAELARIQADVQVPPTQTITTRRSSVSDGAEVLPGSRLRAVAATGGAGVLLTLLLVFFADWLLRRRVGATASVSVEHRRRGAWRAWRARRARGARADRPDRADRPKWADRAERVTTLDEARSPTIFGVAPAVPRPVPAPAAGPIAQEAGATAAPAEELVGR